MLSSKEEENKKIKDTLPCVVCGRETYDTVEVEVLVDYQTIEMLMCEACADRHYQGLETCDFNDC